MMAIAVAVFLGEGRIRGRLRLLAIVVPGLAVPASTMTAGLPVWTAVGAGLPIGLIYVGAVASVALALLAIHGMLDVAGRFGPVASERAPTAEHVRPVPQPA